MSVQQEDIQHLNIKSTSEKKNSRKQNEQRNSQQDMVVSGTTTGGGGCGQINNTVVMNKSYSQDELNLIVSDLDLDFVTIRENHMIPSTNISEMNKKSDNMSTTNTIHNIINNKCDSDLTIHEKENNLLSASRLRLLQDTTMIESALDLDSLDDSSIGNNSQAGLLKIGIV